MAVEARKKMNVPITKPSLGEEEARAPYESIKSGWVTQGPKVAEFEKAVAAYVGAKHGIATTSCTTGLHLALATAGVGPGDEVIVPSFTFIASANAILYTGATVVFAEIDPRTYNIDPNDIEHRITKRTKAIMPVDQIGLSCDMDPINAIAKQHGIDVVEDAAPTIGSTYKGRKTGSNAHQTVFSFHPRKVITTGEGGMITTNDDALADRARKLRAHGMSVSDLDRHTADRVIIEEYNELGFNYRMTDIQASIGLVQLRRLPELLRIRIEKAHRYDRALPAIKGLEVPHVPPYATHTYQSYCLRARPRDPHDEPVAPRHRDAARGHGLAPREDLPRPHREGLAADHRGGHRAHDADPAVRDADRRGADLRHRRAPRGARPGLGRPGNDADRADHLLRLRLTVVLHRLRASRPA
jgi:perosamine synthetase